MPVGVRVTEITNDSIRLAWSRPLTPNGRILGYRLYFMKNDNFTDVVTVRLDDGRDESGRNLDYTLRNLGGGEKENQFGKLHHCDGRIERSIESRQSVDRSFDPQKVKVKEVELVSVSSHRSNAPFDCPNAHKPEPNFPVINFLLHSFDLFVQ